MATVHINTEIPYDVIIETGLLDRCGELIAAVHEPCRVALISESTVAPLYADRVIASLENAHFTVCLCTFPAGEAQKTLSTFGNLLRFMAANDLTRADLAVALGGGVVGDLTGFAAACYERGIPFVQIPTSLLAMVDASVGGKTAVDLPEGKNLAGAFHQPALVLCDCDCLLTLPQDRISDGAAEMLKHALIAAPALFDRLSTGEILPQAEDLICRNVNIKRSFVVGDEHDSGKRQFLNFGHTIGHAVEKCSGYALSHGQAVAIGMAAAVRGANALGLGHVPLDPLLNALRQNGLPTKCPFSAEEIYAAALSDKKRSGDSLNYIILREPGEPALQRMKKDVFRQFLEVALKEASA